MSVQKIPLETVQKIRQYIKTSLTLPESENAPKAWTLLDELEELPEPASLSALGELFNFGGPVEEATNAPNNRGRWFISVMNPGAALLKLPGLRLKPDMRLVSYLYRSENDGMGVTWAVPEELSTTAQLELALTHSSGRHPPHPAGALEDVMQAIEGDRSVASFVVASMLRRELHEFGALGKFCNWSHHRLIQTVPGKIPWKWRIDAPKDLSPKVRVLPDGRAAIEFFTCRVAAPIGLFQHVDQYPADHYTPASLDRSIATAQVPSP